MLKLELLKLTKEYVQYKFFPEDDKDNFGIVQVNRKDHEDCLIIQDAKDVSSVYRRMAIFRVRKLVYDGDFPKTSACAWG